MFLLLGQTFTVLLNHCVPLDLAPKLCTECPVVCYECTTRCKACKLKLRRLFIQRKQQWKMHYFVICGSGSMQRFKYVVDGGSDLFMHSGVNSIEKSSQPTNKLYSDFKFILIIVVMFVSCVLHISRGLTVWEFRSHFWLNIHV